MKTVKFTLIISFFLFSNLLNSQTRGDLISDTLMLTLNKPQIEAMYAGFNIPQFLFPINFETIELHKLVYWTINARGTDIIEASGLVTVPIGACDYPLFNFNHGTLDYDRVLSDLNAEEMQHFAGVPFAANGYLVASPDYLGYGATPIDHPHGYIHSKSEATSVVDMLRATRNFCSEQDIVLNDQLFLTGYSHGGHVTMSTHKELEEFHSDEFTITASAPSGGGYDISGHMLDSMLFSDFYSNPFYIAFTTISYQYVYGDLYDDITEAFVSPYDSIIQLIFNRADPEPNWVDSLPRPGYEILQPTYIDTVLEDSNHPFNVALRANDVYDWIPQAPMHIIHCEGDEQVPYANAIFTREHMLSLGATQVELVNAGIDGHADCAIPATISAKLWFDTYRAPCTITDISNLELSEKIRLYPNPFSDVLYLDASNIEAFKSIDLVFYDMLGRTVQTLKISSPTLQSVAVDNLLPGNYLVKIFTDDQSLSQLMIKIK